MNSDGSEQTSLYTNDFIRLVNPAWGPAADFNHRHFPQWWRILASRVRSPNYLDVYRKCWIDGED